MGKEYIIKIIVFFFFLFLKTSSYKSPVHFLIVIPNHFLIFIPIYILIPIIIPNRIVITIDIDIDIHFLIDIRIVILVSYLHSISPAAFFYSRAFDTKPYLFQTATTTPLFRSSPNISDIPRLRNH